MAACSRRLAIGQAPRRDEDAAVSVALTNPFPTTDNPIQLG
jgi:hypothetical protein